MSGVVVKWLLLWLVPTLLHTLRICVLTTYLPYLSSYVSTHVCSYVRTYVGVYVGLYVGVYVPPYVSTVSCVLCVRRVVLCWSVSLLPPRSHFCLFVHRGSTVCGVLCVSRRVVMLERLSVATTFALLCLCTGEVPCVVSCVSVGGLSCWSVSLLPRSHFSVIPRSTLVLPPCVKIWQTSVAPSKISHLLCYLLQQRSHMAQK
jgi:hypothetical protein